MSVRASVVLLLVGCLGWPATRDVRPAVAQRRSERNGKSRCMRGVVRIGKPTEATTAMPAAGEAFTTRIGRPSRYVSSWYFGDGAALLNQWAAAFTIVPRTARITPLDPVLTGPAARSSDAGSFGLRVGRRLTPRFTAELNVDYGPSTLELSESALGDIEASRTTFASVWNEALGPGTPFLNTVVSSSSEIEEGSGGQIVATGALTVKLRRGGALVPYVTGGLGGVFNHGRVPSVTLKGNYSMGFVFNQAGQVPAGTLVTCNEADTVTVRFVRPDRALVGVVGGGFTYDLSRRHGFRVDLRLHVRPNAVDTELSASPAVTTRTPAAMHGVGNHAERAVQQHGVERHVERARNHCLQDARGFGLCRSIPRSRSDTSGASDRPFFAPSAGQVRHPHQRDDLDPVGARLGCPLLVEELAVDPVRIRAALERMVTAKRGKRFC